MPPKPPRKRWPVPPGSPLEGRVIGRHQVLLQRPSVKAWWESRSLRSRLSADQYLRQLGLLLERLELSPEGVVDLARKDPEKLRELLIQDAGKLKAEGRLDSYVSKFFEGLKAYFRFHRVPFDGWPSLSPIKGASLTAERVPNPEELGRVLEHLSPRGRAVALFMAHTGVRPGVLGSYQAEDGLRLEDLPDLQLDGEPRFSETPFVVRVPARLSKTRQAYTTFGSSQLASALLAYLDDRQRAGETLAPGSAVISPNEARGVAALAKERARFSKGFLTTKQVIEELRYALHESAPRGIERRVGGKTIPGWRPYVLRAYCSSRLLIAEGAGKMTRDLREAILGHDGGVAARYNVGKPWGPELLREARNAYRRSESYLTTVSVEKMEDVVSEMRKALLQGFGYSEDELKGISLGDLDTKGLQKLIEQKRVRRARLESPTQKQKLVRPKELGVYLEKGWTVVTQVAGQVVVSPPAPRAD